MNIGIVTTWFERGAAYVSRQYMEVLQKENNVFIYARSGESYAQNNPEWDFDNVYWSQKIDSPFVVTVIDKNEFINWIKINNIHAIIFNEQHWWYPLIWCYELGVKTVAYIDYYTEQTLPLFGIYDFLICNTKKHLKAFEWHPGARYIPWGTDIELFKPKVSANSNDKVIFFHSCGYAPKRKGTDLLIKAIDKMCSDDYQLIIHTQTNLDNYFPELKPTISKFLENGKLRIIEKTVSAPGLYHLGDIYVYPSRLEGIGLTIAEAISSGLGLLVPDCGPMNEFVDESFGKSIELEKLFSRYDGYYWPQNEVNIFSLAKAMDDIVIQKNNIALMKNSARNYAESHLNWQINSYDILKIFDEKVPSTNNFKQQAIEKINQFEKYGIRKYNKYFTKFPWLFSILKKSAK